MTSYRMYSLMSGAICDLTYEKSTPADLQSFVTKLNERHTIQQPVNCCFDSIQAKEAGIRSLVLIDEQGGKYD